MSKTQNQNFQFWQDVLVSLRRIPSIRGEQVLSRRDDETISQAILMNAQILLDIDSSASIRSFANVKRWCLQTKRLEVSLLDRMMKDILLELRKAIPQSIESFKHSLSYENSVLGSFLAPVTDFILGFCKNPNALDFKTLNQFLSFMTRITLRDVDFQEESLEAYYATEERIKEVRIAPSTLNSLRDIMHEWWDDFSLKEIIPQHGPGGTAFKGRDSNYNKMLDLRFDEKLKYLAEMHSKKVSQSSDPKDRNSCPYRFLPFSKDTPVSNDIRTAEVVFVAKNLSSMRTICMEPTSLMYYQQGVWCQIDRYMSRHKKLSHHIRLHDQTYNKRLSQEGSRDQSFATIDLSAASDSVTWPLMKHLFFGTDYYKAALLTRSTSALLPDGNKITLHKFAPMGSTLCFPTQCLIFAAMCELVIKHHGDRPQNAYSVYGDDIVIREEYAEDLGILLAECGFLLNTEKSYLTGRFKESCGGEFFDGIEVTPLKIPRNFVGTQLTHRTPGLYEGLIAFINLCNQFGFVSTRTFLIRKFQALPKNLQPIFDDGSKGIASTQPTNFHLDSKVNRLLQASYFTHGASRAPTLRCRIEDDISLLMWHIQAGQKPLSKYAFKVPEDVTVVSTAPSCNALRSVKTFDPQGSNAITYEIASRTYVN